MVKRKNKQMGITKRAIYFLIGLIGASILIVFSFQWDLLPFQFTLFSYDITAYILASFLVLTGAFMSSLMKSGMRGNKELDF